MEKMFSIGELSRLLDVPTATLRFWESQGLFSVSKGDNRYRRYSLQDVIRVADIMFYRGWGYPSRRSARPSPAPWRSTARPAAASAGAQPRPGRL